MAESTAERATAGFPWSLESQVLEAASVLAPEQGLLADIDPALFGQAIATAALRAVRDPVGGATLGLIFSYVVSNWLLGEKPRAFDILAWNADSTRMPAAMHSFYLRSCYLENQLARGTMELAGHHLDLADVKQDLYIVAAINDRIVPWTSSYLTTGHVPAQVRFVLSSGGHIAGIVNPPGPKAWYMTAETNPPTAQEWHQAATRHSGSWWEDWISWAAARAGPMVDPPPVGNKKYPTLDDGPGSYVRG